MSGDAGRRGGRPQLVEQRLRRGQLAAENLEEAERAEKQRHDREGTGITGALQLSGDEQSPALLVPHVPRGAAGEREPARLLGWEHGLLAERAQRRLEDRHGDGVTVAGQRRHPLQEEIGRPRRPVRGGAGQRRLADLDEVRAAGEPVGEPGRLERFEIGGARPSRVDRLELAGGLQQQRGSVPTALHGERDLRAQEMHTRALEIVDAAGLRGGEQREGVVERPGLVLRLCRRQRPLRTPDRVRRQRRGALEEGGGSGQAAARLGAAGGLLELAGDGLVGACRRRGEMPGAPVRVDPRVGRVRQCRADAAAFVRSCGAVDGGAHQRMAEPDAGADLDQVGAGERLERRVGEPEASRGAPGERGIAGRVDRGHEQEPPAVGRERVKALHEAVLDASHRWRGLRQAEPAGQFGRREPARQLQEGEWVPTGFHHELVGDPLIQAPGHDRSEEPVVRRHPPALRPPCPAGRRARGSVRGRRTA